MLYPKEDREKQELIFQCRTCLYQEPAASACVHHHDLTNTVGETAGITQDVGTDPTVGLTLLELCTVCGKEIICETCGKPAATGCWLEVHPENDTQTDALDDEAAGYMSDPQSDEDEYELQQIQEMVQNLGILPPITNGNIQNSKQQSIFSQTNTPQHSGQHT